MRRTLRRRKSTGPERKERMSRVLGQLESVGLVNLKEGLRLLASSDRPTAQRVQETRAPDVAAVFCDYGKSTRPKAALEREDAQMLLELISNLETTLQEQTLPAALELASELLLRGDTPPQRTVADKILGPVLRSLRQFDPQAGQISLI